MAAFDSEIADIKTLGRFLLNLVLALVVIPVAIVWLAVRSTGPFLLLLWGFAVPPTIAFLALVPVLLWWHVPLAVPLNRNPELGPFVFLTFVWLGLTMKLYEWQGWLLDWVIKFWTHWRNRSTNAAPQPQQVPIAPPQHPEPLVQHDTVNEEATRHLDAWQRRHRAQ
jgi:hypothetical protein